MRWGWQATVGRRCAHLDKDGWEAVDHPVLAVDRETSERAIIGKRADTTLLRVLHSRGLEHAVGLASDCGAAARAP